MATAAALSTLVAQALSEVSASATLSALEEVRVRLLGKKGVLTEQLKGLGALPSAERPAAGQRINDAKASVQAALESRRAALEAAVLDAELNRGAIDVTLPGRGQEQAGLHPVTRTRLRIERIFMQAGFQVASGPEVEDDFHNFEALNIPKNHPARAMHDTFYFPDGRLLRTHTSPVQIRAMRQAPPPLAVRTPSACLCCRATRWRLHWERRRAAWRRRTPWPLPPTPALVRTPAMAAAVAAVAVAA